MINVVISCYRSYIQAYTWKLGGVGVSFHVHRLLTHYILENDGLEVFSRR